MWNEQILNNTVSNHSVRKFWIYWTLCLLSCFMELCGTLRNLDSQWIIRFTNASLYTLRVILITVTFSSNKGGKLVEYSRYFQDLLYPSQGTQTMLTQVTKKFWTLQPKPSQATLEELSLRSTGKVQQCSLTQWLHNQTSCTCAALQWQRSSGRGAAQRSSRCMQHQQKQQGGWGASLWYVCCIRQ